MGRVPEHIWQSPSSRDHHILTVESQWLLSPVGETTVSILDPQDPSDTFSYAIPMFPVDGSLLLLR